MIIVLLAVLVCGQGWAEEEKCGRFRVWRSAVTYHKNTHYYRVGLLETDVEPDNKRFGVKFENASDATIASPLATEDENADGVFRFELNDVGKTLMAVPRRLPSHRYVRVPMTVTFGQSTTDAVNVPKLTEVLFGGASCDVPAFKREVIDRSPCLQLPAVCPAVHPRMITIPRGRRRYGRRRRSGWTYFLVKLPNVTKFYHSHLKIAFAGLGLGRVSLVRHRSDKQLRRIRRIRERGCNVMNHYTLFLRKPWKTSLKNWKGEQRLAFKVNKVLLTPPTVAYIHYGDSLCDTQCGVDPCKPTPAGTTPVPEVSTPGPTVPEVSTPGPTVPEVSTPPPTVPEVSTPGQTVPEVTPGANDLLDEVDDFWKEDDFDLDNFW